MRKASVGKGEIAQAEARSFLAQMGGASVVHHLTFATEPVLAANWSRIGESGRDRIFNQTKWPDFWPRVRKWSDMLEEQQEFLIQRVKRLSERALERLHEKPQPV